MRRGSSSSARRRICGARLAGNPMQAEAGRQAGAQGVPRGHPAQCPPRVLDAEPALLGGAGRRRAAQQEDGDGFDPPASLTAALALDDDDGDVPGRRRRRRTMTAGSTAEGCASPLALHIETMDGGGMLPRHCAGARPAGRRRLALLPAPPTSLTPPSQARTVAASSRHCTRCPPLPPWPRLPVDDGTGAVDDLTTSCPSPASADGAAAAPRGDGGGDRVRNGRGGASTSSARCARAAAARRRRLKTGRTRAAPTRAVSSAARRRAEEAWLTEVREPAELIDELMQSWCCSRARGRRAPSWRGRACRSGSLMSPSASRRRSSACLGLRRPRRRPRRRRPPVDSGDGTGEGIAEASGERAPVCAELCEAWLLPLSPQCRRARIAYLRQGSPTSPRGSSSTFVSSLCLHVCGVARYHRDGDGEDE